ncbi:MAG: lysophospholipase [Oscillospiraceae bacterium]|jgi:alpha-beta hydrolase superfamily lysophospholipase|nr:lysophospholipase [Oscillospiraceae bacterium]
MRNYVLSRAFNEMAIGTPEQRTDGVQPTYPQAQRVKAGALAGFAYLPERPNGKTVIFFSGSEGSNAAMLGDAANEYCAHGFAVLGVDYRGFGENAAIPSKCTEQEFYADARVIFDFARQSVEAEQIILHGFSLGGAVAAWLALALAQQGVHIGGLALHSSIKTMTHAAKQTLPLPAPLAWPLGWLGGQFTGGGYNTKKYLRQLAKIYPEIPLHFIGGNAQDELNLHETKLEQIPGFTRKSVHHGDEPHQINGKRAANLNFDFWEDWQDEITPN